MFEAAKVGDFAEVSRLVASGAPVDWADSHGWTALRCAAFSGDLDNGWTPLLSAASSGHRNIAVLLLLRGADAEVTAKDGWTALHLAARSGNAGLVRTLLKAGADPDAKMEVRR
ncbi:hypothetical protein FNF28_01562 [Cafeteria roenbergensis]|uniref:Uncharacterized protein n=1 Tax=Cafeteria roenbergensis TaxID=33653 RepID=A0A5A8E045_CAFRO|nr:hypothetical protein FNF28_01562 [Cafeteria roenbergensis]